MRITEMFDLTGKKAIVTGGSRGLGRGIAQGLAQAGAFVVISGAGGHVWNTEKELKAQGLKIRAVQADFSDRREVEKLFPSRISIAL